MSELRKKMESMVGDHSHKDCRNSRCQSYKKGEKAEHIFIETRYGVNYPDWGWKCMSCGEFTKVYGGS